MSHCTTGPRKRYRNISFSCLTFNSYFRVDFFLETFHWFYSSKKTKKKKNPPDRWDSVDLPGSKRVTHLGSRFRSVLTFLKTGERSQNLVSL